MTPSTSDPEATLEQIRAANPGTLMDRLGIEWVETSAERVVARMPVDGNMQPFGVLHGGATAALVESIGSVGAFVGADRDVLPLGIEVNVNHLRAVRSGVVTATGTPLHAGRTTTVWDIRITDDAGQLTAIGRLTVLLRDIDVDRTDANP